VPAPLLECARRVAAAAAAPPPEAAPGPPPEEGPASGLERLVPLAS